jgi:hypothetical protein
LLANEIGARPEDASAAFDQQCVGDVMANGGQVMTHNHQGSIGGMPPVDVSPEQCLTEFVQGGMGFVEQQQWRIGEAQASEQRTLQLAPRKGHQGAPFEAAQAPIFQYRFETITTPRRRLLTAPETGGDQFLKVDGELAIQMLLLRQKREGALAWNIQLGLSRERFLQTGDDFQQAAFAAAIGTDHGGHASL